MLSFKSIDTPGRWLQRSVFVPHHSTRVKFFRRCLKSSPISMFNKGRKIRQLHEKDWCCKMSTNHLIQRSPRWISFVSFSKIQIRKRQWETSDEIFCRTSILHFTRFIENDRIWNLSEGQFPIKSISLQFFFQIEKIRNIDRTFLIQETMQFVSH